MTGFYPRGIALHEKLQRLAIEAGQGPLTLGDGLRRLAAASNDYGIPLLLLSLANALPVPTFGLKCLLGVVVTLLGLQMFAGKRSVWLPRWFTRIRLRSDWSQRAARLGERFLPMLERFVKPRMHWMRYRPCASLLGLVVILLGLLMTLPVPGTNTLPSLVLLALSIGLIESDGLLMLLAAMAALVVVALYTEVVYLLVIWLAW
ncbi:MAG: exopolysaccharide biosynthesis protein [Pseudomonadota bacterium]|nr:exopolysaccharide biosynthesis protein [Pseudomonadota bacterium]